MILKIILLSVLVISQVMNSRLMAYDCEQLTPKWLDDQICNRQAKTVVIGLGYVGLPLCVALAEANYSVTGLDISEDRVGQINAGQSYIDDIASSKIHELIQAKQFVATTDAACIASADIVLLCVPTPCDEQGRPDLRVFKSAATLVQSYIKPNTLVVVRSTVYPGATEEIVAKLLEDSGLQVGEQCFLAFVPERIDPGNDRWTVANTPTVIGGMTARCSALASRLFENLLQPETEICIVASPKVAELTKLLENSYRLINIAFVEELAQLCHALNVDVWDVIDAAKSKPFGFQAFEPGVGAGGYCIPVAPRYLAWKASELGLPLKSIEWASQQNDEMASYVVKRIGGMLSKRGIALKGARILCLGASFKSTASDTRNSRAVVAMNLLAQAGADVYYMDPKVPAVSLGDRIIHAISASDISTMHFDCAAVLVKGNNWPLKTLQEHGALIFDACNSTRFSRNFCTERL